MSLLRLPPETLKQIFDHIGSSFFRQDLGRLTICKKWFEFARPGLFKCITLSQETLRRLICSSVTKTLALLKNSQETLDLELGGYQAWISTRHRRQDPQESIALNAAALNEALRDNPVEAWINVLDKDLTQLATIVQQSRSLRILRIRAWNSPSPDPLDRPQDYLSVPTMQALLSVGNLSVLALDLSVGFLDSSGENGGHICPAIGALLRTLGTLHLRMSSICPDVLKPPHPDDSLRLSVAVINLSLTKDLPGITSAAHSSRCGSAGGGLLQLKGDMVDAAEALAAGMTSPKTLRILTDSLPHFEIQSLDVLTGKTMMLDDDMAWDEDGKTVKEDSEPESKLLDNDFAGFLDNN
ncbi:hypothetical protein N0V84_011712 [Fusarium piperis]|uniref:F-box domain-containing protein n=1 Tax=Fusarium piperis TaxID=1435070 RepID=A0A9W8TDE4_9HYPO|nr:hypothetical protein N0V84_011712 [Fusarium piperis]